MTGNGAKTPAGDEKSLVEVRRKSAKNVGFEGVLNDLGD